MLAVQQMHCIRMMFLGLPQTGALGTNEALSVGCDLVDRSQFARLFVGITGTSLRRVFGRPATSLAVSVV